MEQTTTTPGASWLPQVHGLGASSLLAYSAHVLCSYGSAELLPRGGVMHEGAMLIAAARALGAEHPALEHWLSGRTLEATGSVGLAISLAGPLLVTTLVFVALMALLQLRAEQLDARSEQCLWRWSLAFASVSVFALPVSVGDYWLSFAWGRQIVAGDNPYFIEPMGELLRGLPLDRTHQIMTYGPGWALLCALIAWLGAGHWWLEALLFKALLFGAWVGVVRGSLALLDGRPRLTRAVALAVLGWMPLTIHFGVAEGHNDVVMVLGMVGWLLALHRGAGNATLWLVLGTLVKYVTAPLLALDAFHRLVVQRIGFARYVRHGLLAAIPIVVAFAPFLTSLDMFDVVRGMRDWKFYRPADALMPLTRRLEVPTWLVERAFDVVLLGWCVIVARRYWRDRDEPSLHALALAIVTMLLFTRVGHVWPWFLVWCLPLCVLQPAAFMSRFCVGLGLVAPFMMLALTLDVGGTSWFYKVPAMVAYATALGWVALSRVARARLQPALG